VNIVLCKGKLNFEDDVPIPEVYLHISARIHAYIGLHKNNNTPKGLYIYVFPCTLPANSRLFRPDCNLFLFVGAVSTF